MTLRHSVVMLSLLAGGPSFGAITLDKLTNCAEIARVHNILSTDARSLGQCRTPSNAVERAFLADLGPALANQLCFFEAGQFRMLQGFSCVRSKAALPDLTCFRSASPSDLDDYKSNRDTKYSEAATNYRANAAQCGISNGDSGASGPMPWLLGWSSKYEVGSFVALGDRQTKTADSIAHHGFATSTGRMAAADAPAIEFINVYIQLPTTNMDDSSERLFVGSWLLTIDDADALDKAYTEQLRKGTRGFGNYTWFEVLSRSPREVPRKDKIALLESWEDVVVDALESEGFEEFTDISEAQKSDLHRQVTASQPRMLRDLPIKVHDRFIVMRSESDPDCALRDGLMLAVVMAMQPNPDTDSDFGGVGVGIVGVDACGSVSRTRSFVDGTIDSVKSAMRETLE